MEKQTIATLTLNKGDVGGLRNIGDRLKSTLRASVGDVCISVDTKRKELYVRAEKPVAEESINAALETSHIPFNLEYHGFQQVEEKQEVQEDSSEKYHILVNKVRKREGELQVARKTISNLESKVGDSEKQKTELEKKLNQRARAYEELRTRTEISSVQDLISDMMSRENRMWSIFMKGANDILRAASDLYGIPREELEKECLDYVPTEERPEFKKIKGEYEAAQKAIEFAAANPFVNVDNQARDLVSQVEVLSERDENLRIAREDIMRSDYIKNKIQRIIISSEGEDTLVHLPFKLKKSYPGLEQELVSGIETYVSSGKKNYEFDVEDFNGLARYRIKELGKMAKRKLPEAISSMQDCFTRLGGKREIVYMNIFR